MIQENPPRNTEEEVESFEGHEINPDATEEQLRKETEELKAEFPVKRALSPEEEDKMAELRYNLSINRTIEDIVAKKPKGDEVWTIPKNETHNNVQRSTAFRRLRNAFMALFAFTALSSTASAKAPDNTKEKDLNATVKTVEAQSSTNNETDSTIAVYTKSKTEKGGITPTGFSNSFLENDYGITSADIDSLANRYGFSTKNEKEFQRDMIEYAQKNDPEIIQYVLKHFGQTEYGIKNNMAPDDYRQLIDGLLGRRLVEIMKFYKDKEVPNEKEVDYYSEFAEHGDIILSTGAGGHTIGELCYKTRETNDLKDAGNTETSKTDAILRLRNDFGFTGEVVELTKDEVIKIFKGTRHVQDNDLLAKILNKSTKVVSN